MPRRSAVPLVLSVLILVLAVVLSARPQRTLERSAPTRSSATRGGARGGAEELEEQRETVELREEAFREATAGGAAAGSEPIRRRSAPGWAGERPFHPRANDWEPAIATDPNEPYVYVLVTRYGGPGTCRMADGKCLSPSIVLEVSDDEGRTWSRGRQMCVCRAAKGQFDPIIEVAPDTGEVYAVWMNDYHVVFSKSADHGDTWTKPVPTYGKVAWNDKPVLATSDDGRDVYVSWNGPSGGDLWVAQSHDSGATWGQRKVVESDRYYFAFDADVLPDGTVVFAQSSLTYAGPEDEAQGVVRQHVVISHDAGGTWVNQVVDTVEPGRPCVAIGCGTDFYLGHPVIAGDDVGSLVFLYDGATRAGAKQLIFVRRSTDGGLTWSEREALSEPGEQATMPAVESAGAGDVRAWYVQENGGPKAWNVWYRASTDGGITWSEPINISDATSGAAYKNPAGFLEPYGDYGEISITSGSRTIAVWGEGFSWTGPGGTWINRQR
jgi:hypothetical protein